MSLQRILSLLLVAVLAGVAGFIMGRRLEDRRAPALPPSPASQALAGRENRPLPGLQPVPTPPRETPPPESHQASASAEVTAAASPDEAQTLITVADNRLSVQVQDRSLWWVLNKISHQSGIPILLGAEIEDQTVSSHFQDLPLDQGLQVLLKTLDAFFFYGAQGEAPVALKVVWLYPQGEGQRIVPAPPETYASTAEMEQNLRDPDPAQRARAVEVLMERQGTRALDAVLQVLEDPDEQVRSRALHQVVQLNFALPEPLMQYLALSDVSPLVRFLALTAIANAPSLSPEQVREIAEQALNDPSAEVQMQAETILATLENAQQPEDPSEPLQGQEEDKAN